MRGLRSNKDAFERAVLRIRSIDADMHGLARLHIKEPFGLNSARAWSGHKE
jgi:hypothetical protein